jgi:hypothetical protein
MAHTGSAGITNCVFPLRTGGLAGFRAEYPGKLLQADYTFAPARRCESRTDHAEGSTFFYTLEPNA